MKQLLRVYLCSPILCCLLFLALLGGCRSSQQYIMLARDGASSSGAVAAIADRANALRIESSSYILLQQRHELSKKYKDQPLKKELRALLRQSNLSDRNALDNNRYTKEVATSLQSYFIALQELAASNAPADIGAKTGDIIAKIDDLLQAKNLAPFSFPSSIAPIAVTYISDRDLRKELISRKGSILKALMTLDALLSTLSQDIDAHAMSIRNARLAMLIQPSYLETTSASLTTLSDNELWVNLRQRDLLGSTTENEDKRNIAEAQKSSRKFRELFMKMTAE